MLILEHDALHASSYASGPAKQLSNRCQIRTDRKPQNLQLGHVTIVAAVTATDTYWPLEQWVVMRGCMCPMLFKESLHSCMLSKDERRSTSVWRQTMHDQNRSKQLVHTRARSVSWRLSNNQERKTHLDAFHCLTTDIPMHTQYKHAFQKNCRSEIALQNQVRTWTKKKNENENNKFLFLSPPESTKMQRRILHQHGEGVGRRGREQGRAALVFVRLKIETGSIHHPTILPVPQIASIF